MGRLLVLRLDYSVVTFIGRPGHSLSLEQLLVAVALKVGVGGGCVSFVLPCVRVQRGEEEEEKEEGNSFVHQEGRRRIQNSMARNGEENGEKLCIENSSSIDGQSRQVI